MKRISMLLVVFMCALMLATPVLASGNSVQDVIVSGETQVAEEVKLSDASETTIKKLETKDEKLAYYSEKCGDPHYGMALYYLYEIQKYSLPVCFIGLVIASLNFFIIGNKKLDKREQGFGMLIAFGLGLIVFQVLPLLFAIIVAGR